MNNLSRTKANFKPNLPGCEECSHEVRHIAAASDRPLRLRSGEARLILPGKKKTSFCHRPEGLISLTPLPATCKTPPPYLRPNQFVTQYQQAGGGFRLRATTVCGGWHSDPVSLEPLVRGYDQEAAAVLMARIAVHRTETEEVQSFFAWIFCFSFFSLKCSFCLGSCVLVCVSSLLVFCF